MVPAMAHRTRARSAVAAVAVVLAMIIGQIAGARASLCPMPERAAPCRCCAEPPRAEPPPLDAQIAPRCCAIEEGDLAVAVPDPVARSGEAAPALVAVTPAFAVVARVALAPRPPLVIARASGPPVWLATRSLRL